MAAIIDTHHEAGLVNLLLQLQLAPHSAVTITANGLNHTAAVARRVNGAFKDDDDGERHDLADRRRPTQHGHSFDGTDGSPCRQTAGGA